MDGSLQLRKEPLLCTSAMPFEKKIYATICSLTRKARERELAKFDENRRAQMAENVIILNPIRDKNEGMYRGGEGKTPVTKS